MVMAFGDGYCKALPLNDFEGKDTCSAAERKVTGVSVLRKIRIYEDHQRETEMAYAKAMAAAQAS